ncbi:hypothetical protein [Variovorax sp. KK3]|uniref:hypothetical protein n=1 Tax=Variovorax sp. KK3 TaxID=1855728 RepID=UPI00097BE0DE|nr:hypothetical protein [Variovorax sp. KK3]
MAKASTSLIRRPAVPATDETLIRERLRAALPATVELLKQRQADRIADADIEAYVSLNWLEWHGGGLRLTITGRNICAQTAAAAA